MDFFGRLCIPTIIYALLYTIFLYENTGGILVTLFAIVTGVYSLYCMQILHIEAKPLTIWYSVMMILTGLSSGLTGNKIIQGFNFCWILVFLVFMLLHNFCNDRQWGACLERLDAFMDIYRVETAGEGHVKKHRMLYVFIGIAIAFPLVVLMERLVLLWICGCGFASVMQLPEKKTQTLLLISISLVVLIVAMELYFFFIFALSHHTVV